MEEINGLTNENQKLKIDSMTFEAKLRASEESTQGLDRFLNNENERLKTEIERLQRERDALNNNLELLKKSGNIDFGMMSELQ
jgi:predicted  nucleic acid-binding Zn-ribbon protein